MDGVRKTFATREEAEAYRLQLQLGEADLRNNRTAGPPQVEPLQAEVIVEPLQAEVIDLTDDKCGVCDKQGLYGHVSFRHQGADGTPGDYEYRFCAKHWQEANQGRVYTCACPPCNNVVDSDTHSFEHEQYGFVRLCSEHAALQYSKNCCRHCPLMYKEPNSAKCSKCNNTDEGYRWC